MLGILGKLGDRVLAKVVPQVTAEAASVLYVICGCWETEKPRQYRRFIKSCDTCLCYEAGAC